MTAPRVSIDYLRDILDAMRKAREFVGETSFEQFQRDDKTLFATVRALEVIGEAAKQVGEDVRQRYPNVPWSRMAAMRDKLIHAYFGVDDAIVWETVTRLIPDLEPVIAGVVEAEEAVSAPT